MDSSLDSEDGSFHDPKHFDAHDGRYYPNTKLRRAEHLKRRLVCVGREEDLGAEVPLVHSSINESVLKFHDKVTFYENLNEEIAYLVSCYDSAKAISLKAFFIDEAHITCEWLIDMVEADMLLMFRSSDVNIEDLKKQRDSINGIRNELHGLLMHPAFSSRNMTPNRILRLSDDFNEWTPWQDANFNALMKDYSNHCDSGQWWESPECRMQNPSEKTERYCTYESSIVFIYNSEREKHKKPVEAVESKEVFKKYRHELKNDPTFVAFLESKGKGATAKTKRIRRGEEEKARPKTQPATRNIAHVKEDAEAVLERRGSLAKKTRSTSLASLFNKKKKNTTTTAKVTKRKSAGDLLPAHPGLELKQAMITGDDRNDRRESTLTTNPDPPPPSPANKRSKTKKKKLSKTKVSSRSLCNFLKIAGCGEESVLLSPPLMLPTPASRDPAPMIKTSTDALTPERRSRGKDKKKSHLSSTRSLSCPLVGHGSLPLPPLTEEREEEEEEKEEKKEKSKRSKTLPFAKSKRSSVSTLKAMAKLPSEVASLSKKKNSSAFGNLLGMSSKTKAVKALTYK